MGYVPIGCAANYSTKIINYGPEGVEMRMKPKGAKGVRSKDGIIVQLKKHSRLRVNDCAILEVTWHPTKDNFPEKDTEVKRTVHIQVNYRRNKMKIQRHSI